MSMLLLMEDSFLPYDLFRANEQGIWLDPSDFSTLFQDSAGTTPVTAVGQPVGLALDKRLGLVLGAELVTNGGFDANTGWTQGAGWSISGGRAVRVPAGGGSTISQSATIKPGVTYKVEFDYYGLTSTGLYASFRGGAIAVGPVISVSGATGRYSGFIRATSGNNTLDITSPDASTTGSFDNFTIKEIAGNHAYQTTLAARPTLEARVNLFTKSEQFNDAAWTKALVTVTPNAAVAPDGTTTAAKIIATASSGGHYVTQSGVGRCIRIHAKAAELSWLLVYSGVSGSNVYVNLSTGEYVTAPDVVSVFTTDKGDGWWQVDITWATPSTAPRIYGTTGNGTIIWTGDGVSGIYIWGADLRLTSDSAYPYQKVNTSTDYVDVGAPRYLQFDGTDDSMATPSIDFTGTDKVTVWAGVRKLSDAALGIICELTADAPTLDGFYVAGPGFTASATYRIAVGTPSAQILSSATFAAPVSNVLAVSYDKAQSTAATVMALRTNGTLNAYSVEVEDNPSGNFANATLYIGRRNNASLPFNGRIYQLIVRGAASNAGQIAAGEAWCNGKTRAY